MANFKIKNNFKAESVKLVDATAYQVENGTWYMELQYEYEDKSGVHRRYYPKVEFPCDSRVGNERHKTTPFSFFNFIRENYMSYYEREGYI